MNSNNDFDQSMAGGSGSNYLGWGAGAGGGGGMGGSYGTPGAGTNFGPSYGGANRPAWRGGYGRESAGAWSEPGARGGHSSGAYPGGYYGGGVTRGGYRGGYGSGQAGAGYDEGGWRGSSGGFYGGTSPNEQWQSDYNRDYTQDYDQGQGQQRGQGRPMGTEAWLQPGPYAGRGPKGYARSDTRILEDVSDRLYQHGGIDASEIEITVSEGIVTLQGSVDSRNTKRMAEDVTAGVPGVKDVLNMIRVDQNWNNPSGQGNTQPQQGQRDKSTRND